MGQIYSSGFKGMKASNADTCKIVFPCYISLKIDGIRCHHLPTKGAKTCTLRPVPNEYIRSEIERIMHEYFPEDVIDGEITSGSTFQDCQSSIMSKNGTPEFTYHIFDCIKEGTNVYSFRERYEYLYNKVQIVSKKYPSIKLVQCILVNSMEELLKIYDEYVLAGAEGAMLRAPDAVYKFGRSTVKEGYLLKLKPLKSSEARVVGFVEAMENTNEAYIDALGHTKRAAHAAHKIPKGTLGALQVQDINNELWEFEIGTGIGLTQMLRKEIWDNQEKYLGKIITYKYQAVGIKDKPRIPKFCGFRAEEDLACDY